jgi:hypothetical protein
VEGGEREVSIFKRRPKTAAVLGCGPAGLLAASSLVHDGYAVRIFSKKRPSELFGTQYLHEWIPTIMSPKPEARVRYELRGTVDGYREKVYGSTPVVVSPETLERDHDAWNIRGVYGALWEDWESSIEPVTFSPEAVADLVKTGGFRRVVSSIPLPYVCQRREEHRFEKQNVWAAGDAPERDRWCPVDVAEESQIICDGTRDVGWYRHSKVFGYRSVEWPYRAERKPPIAGLTLIEKPVSTTCDCFADSIVRVGRYGKWTKSVLSHTAYWEATA